MMNLKFIFTNLIILMILIIPMMYEILHTAGVFDHMLHGWIIKGA